MGMFITYLMEQHLIGIVTPLTMQKRRHYLSSQQKLVSEGFFIRSFSTYLKKLNSNELEDSTQL